MSVRRIAVPSFAKINLTLHVLHKRADNYHELRTVFQTISVHDTLEIEYHPGARSVTIESDVEIADNIIVRAANRFLDDLGLAAAVHFRLHKRIPMGGGLGGGSSNAAAVLLALTRLAGMNVPHSQLHGMASALGSDVPFFLTGGTMLGLSRGEDMHPFPEPQTSYGLLITPGIHVSTPEAYRALERSSAILEAPQGMPSGLRVGDWGDFCQNDFEEVVFRQHPELEAMRMRLLQQGAQIARMSGSGSSLFGFFATEDDAQTALGAWDAGQAEVFHTVDRRQYETAWSNAFSTMSD